MMHWIFVAVFAMINLGLFNVYGAYPKYNYNKKKELLPNTFKDVFLQPSGRPTFGMSSTTCWARGGMCVDLRECPSLQFDGTVPGCRAGFKVCCRNFKKMPAEVGYNKIAVPNLRSQPGPSYLFEDF